MQNNDLIVGRNSVIEAIKAKRNIKKLLLLKGSRKGSINEIIKLAELYNIPIETIDEEKIKRLSPTTLHQGVIAVAEPLKYYEIEEVLNIAKQRDEEPFLILLDELQDPQNVGAIIRTAGATGVHGVLLPKRRSCQITPTVIKASAGVLEHVPIVRIGNIAQTLDNLKKQGLWVIGTDMNADKKYTDEKFDYPLVVIIGSEGKGISRLTKEKCDILLNIPMKPNVSSLNASVACALILYEVVRKRV